MSNISFENFIAKTNYLESKGIFILSEWKDNKVYAIVKQNNKTIKGKVPFDSCVTMQKTVANSLYEKIINNESNNNTNK